MFEAYSWLCSGTTSGTAWGTVCSAVSYGKPRSVVCKANKWPPHCIAPVAFFEIKLMIKECMLGNVLQLGSSNHIMSSWVPLGSMAHGQEDTSAVPVRLDFRNRKG